jgi:hypothetical protein
VVVDAARARVSVLVRRGASRRGLT